MKTRTGPGRAVLEMGSKPRWGGGKNYVQLLQMFWKMDYYKTLVG